MSAMSATPFTIDRLAVLVRVIDTNGWNALQAPAAMRWTRRR